MPNETKDEMDYAVVTAAERLNMAREFLRAREQDAYRSHLSRLASPGAAIATPEDEHDALKALRAEVRRLEKEVA